MFVCPVDGPRLSESSSGTQLLTWADASSGDSRVWVSQSTDDGETWLGDQMVADDSGGAQNRPTIAQGADGTVWLTMDKLGTSDVLLSSTDGGSTFDSGRAISTPGGDLEIPELCSGGALTGLVGIAGDGALYWVGL